ncbi:arylsulfatase [Dasania marina]|uniref:arylsulfatase n=1 Tax=Dasania marina TaxID=471499 RepID=UPI0030D986B7
MMKKITLGLTVFGRRLFLCLLLTPLAYAMSQSPEPEPELESSSNTKQPPNILLIVVDDMGYTDIGSFGGEIATPNLDALAYQGVRFTNFQTAPTCSPTRAMLLTGVDNHKAGLGNMEEELAPNQKGQPGYEGYLNKRVVTVASLLRDAGYNTYMAGKWHLGLADHSSPYQRGFDRTFSMLSGGASHFSDMKPAYAPTPVAKAPYRKNGKLLSKLPKNFHYSSQFYTDSIIENIEQDKAQGKPFFAYLAYTAPHWPIQAPDKTIAKYKGRYDSGYEALYTQRLNKQKELGLLPAAQATTASPSIRPWNELTKDQQKIESRRMEIYAAMVDEVDSHTGRLVSYLKQNNLFDNTVIIFMSDNGAEGHNLDNTWPKDTYPKIRKVIDDTHDFSFDNMGKPSSYTFLAEAWARASSPALKYYKGSTTEGGTRVAAFAHYPKHFRAGAIENNLVSVKDLTPTLLDIVGITAPKDSYKGRPIEPITGISMATLLTDGVLPQAAQQRVLGIQLMGKRAIRKGDWKLVHMPAPYGNGEWQLYNLKNDLAEANDLAISQPKKLQEMLTLWQQYATENNVILPDWVSGY